jgi:hypothetical protein
VSLLALLVQVRLAPVAIGQRPAQVLAAFRLASLRTLDAIDQVLAVLRSHAAVDADQFLAQHLVVVDSAQRHARPAHLREQFE